MLEELFLSRRWIERFREPPFGRYVDAFADDLAESGYVRLGIRRAVSAVNRFGRWLQKQHLGVEDASEQTIAQFRGRRWSSSCRHGEALLNRFLQRLRQNGLAPPPIPKKPTPLDQLEFEFRAYLERERGIASTTMRNYTAVARNLMLKRFGSDPIDLSTLSIQDIQAFVSTDGCGTSPPSTRRTLPSLRGFLNFLYVTGRIATPLAEHVPRPPCGRYDPPPKWLSADDVNRVLQHCDRRSPIGKRDFAILMLLARLGLRAGEIISLRLDDLRWESGELSVCGKARQRKRFPLTQDVGAALVTYLKHGRPPCESRRVFLRTRAPWGALTSASAVYVIVSGALARAGLSPPCRGSHLFRHSLATAMMRRGATLTEIGQILHHQSPSTTAIYAKVDITGLRALAMPWPGEEHEIAATRT